MTNSRSVLWRCAAGTWAFFILVLLLMPGSSVPTITFWPSAVPFDKSMHVSLFFVQTLLAWKSRSAGSRPSKAVLASFLGSCLFGIITELLQSIAVQRSASFADALADIIGSAACALLLTLRRHPRTRG